MDLQILIVIGLLISFSITLTRLIISNRDGKIAKQELAKVSSELYHSNDKYNSLQILLNENEEKYIGTIKRKDELFCVFNKKSSDSLERISSLMADHLTLQYKISENYLSLKKHPALTEARRIKDLREKTAEIITKSKLLQYKYEYLLQLFPDLELYVDDIESISELTSLNNVEQLENAVDKTRYFLTKEEYRILPEMERNQLALDRYINSTKKSKWQIGRDYELFVGFQYAQRGWDVEYFGIEKRIEDMGIDLIAKKNNDVHIIQCKYWADNKLIHEKHIAQIYGTTAQYSFSSKTEGKVVPVFITNISLSDTAKSFADILKVRVCEHQLIKEFPRIKCNINIDENGNKTKIYHLPMDQQYDKTKICNEGEFFAYTVKEAVEAGFRRAWRWSGNN